MAKIFLDNNEARKQGGLVNGDVVLGGGGQETVLINNGIINVALDQNVETVAFTGRLSDYAFKQAGNTLQVFSGSSLISTIALQDDADGTALTFGDGTVSAKFDLSAAATTGATIKLGSATVSAAAPAAVTVPAADITPGTTEDMLSTNLHTLTETSVTVTDPDQVESVLTWEGLPVGADSVLDFFRTLAGTEFAEIGKDMNMISGVKEIEFSADGTSAAITLNLSDNTTIDINSIVGLEYLSFLKNMIFDENGVSRLQNVELTTPGESWTEAAAIVLTPTENNGGTLESGFTTADNDFIVAGRTELIHGAYIDGGAGYNTLEVDMKGVFAQAQALINIQEIHLQNLPNIYTAADGSSTYDPADATGSLSTGTRFIDSTIDLNRALDLQKLVITEGPELGGSGHPAERHHGVTGVELGNLTVAGIRNDATVRLEGAFTKEVTLQFGQGMNGSTEVELALGDTENFQLNVAQNASVLNLKSEGYENWLKGGNFGGALSKLNITGEGKLYIEDALQGFHANRTAIVDASSNTGGVQLTFEDQASVRFLGSTGGDHFTSTDSDLVDITGGIGNNTFITDGSDVVKIVTLGGDDTISSVRGDKVTIEAGAGHNDITVSANEISITAGSGDDKITVSGMDLEYGYDGYDPARLLDGFTPGALLNINTGTGQNTVTLGRDIEIGHREIDLGIVALEGSVITGSNITLFVENDADLTQATLTGITSVVLKGELTVTADQFKELGADVFVADRAASANNVTNLHIIVSESVTLTELLDGNTLNSSVKLTFEITNDATLTLTAEQLHLLVAEDGIDVSTGPNGNVVITDAGLEFDAFTDGQGGGSLTNESDSFQPQDDLDIIVNVNGFERPTPDDSTYTLTIDSDITPVISTAIVSNQLNTLEIIGSADLEFRAPINLGEDFTIDFSALEGELTGLTVKDFQDVKEVIGNGSGTRINIELNDDVGKPGAGNGLKTSGVAEYVVTSVGDIDNEVTFYACDNTKDVQVVGLQGNNFTTVVFEELKHVTLLLEGDGFANFDEAAKASNADLVQNESNVGTVIANFHFQDENAVVNINNQGVALGLTSTGEPRPLVVDGIEVNNAASVTMNIADGNAQIRSIAGDDLKDVTLTTDGQFDVTLYLDSYDSALESIDASDVAGFATLVIEGEVDLSATELIDIEGMVLWNDSSVTLTQFQLDAIGIADITLDGEEATINVFGVGEAPFIVTAFADGITLGTVTIADQPMVSLHWTSDLTGASLIVPEGTILNLTAKHFQQLAGAGTIVGIDADGNPTTDFTVNIVALTQADVDGQLDLTGIAADHITLALAEDVRLADDTILPDLTNPNTDFHVILGDNKVLTLDNYTQANGLDIDGGANSTVVFAFDQVPGPFGGAFTTIDASGYMITRLGALDVFVDNRNVELIIQGLPGDPAGTPGGHNVLLEIYHDAEDLGFVGSTDRHVEIDAGLTVDGFLVFNDVRDDVEVRTLELKLDGGVEIDGNLRLSTVVKDADLTVRHFDTLTIQSHGTAENLITKETANVITGSITADGVPNLSIDNNLLNVVINATQDLKIDGNIVFNGVTAEDHVATLTLNGSADVSIGALVDHAGNDNVDVVNVVATSLVGKLFLGTVALDAGDDLNITLGAGATLVIQETTDLSQLDLHITQVKAIVLEDNAVLTLTAAQANGLRIVASADTDGNPLTHGTVNIVDLGDTAVDLSGIDTSIAGTITLEDNDVTLAAATNLGAQNGFTIHLDSLLDAGLSGQTIRFQTVAQAQRDIEVTDDPGLGLNSSNVVWLFTEIPGTNPVDTKGYSEFLGRLWFKAELVNKEGGLVESLFTTLPNSVLRVDFATVQDVNLALANSLEFDRIVELVNNTQVGDLTFSDVGLTPEEHIKSLTIKLGGQVTTGNILVDDVIDATHSNAASVSFDGITIESHRVLSDENILASQGGGNIPKFINNNDGINDAGEKVQPTNLNTVGNIGVGPNHGLDLLSVTLDTLEVSVVDNGSAGSGARLDVGTITYETDALLQTAHLDVAGANNIHIDAVNTADAGITALTLDATGFTGVLTIPGASPALQVDNTETVTIRNGGVAAGTITLGNATNAGVAGNELSAINAAGFGGTLNLGTLAQIDSTNDGSNPAFTLTAGTGRTTATLGAANNLTPTLNAGSEWIFNYAGDVTNPASNSLTIKDTAVFQAGATLDLRNVPLIIDGNVDLSMLLDNDATVGVTEGLQFAGGSIFVGAGDSLKLDASQLAQIDMLDITGSGTVEVVGDASNQILGSHLNTVNVDISAVQIITDNTNPAQDTDDRLDLFLGGALNDAGLFVGQNVTGSGFNDLIMTSNGNDTIAGGAGDDMMFGGLGSNTYLADAGTDTIFGLSTGTGLDTHADVLVVSTGATAKAAGIVNFVATAATVNNGTAELTSAPASDAMIDVHLATGSKGFTLTGGTDNIFGRNTLIGSNQDDIINGGNNNQGNAGAIDILTGKGGADIFDFNLQLSTPVQPAIAVTTVGVDRELLTITADGVDDGNESIVLTYSLNNAPGNALTINNPALNFTDAAALTAAVQSAVDVLGGITAVVNGNTVEISGDNGNSVTLASSVSGTVNTLAVLVGAPADTPMVATLTIDPTVTINEEYRATVTLATGEIISAPFTAATTNPADVATGLATAFNLVALLGTVSAAAVGSVVTFTDQNADNGDFTLTGSALGALSGTGASGSPNVGNLSLAFADIINDFDSGTDQIKLHVEDGSATNYVEAAQSADYQTAFNAANLAFDTTVKYFLTSIPDIAATVGVNEATGLLFFDADGNGEPDGVISLVGVTAADFAFGDIIV